MKKSHLLVACTIALVGAAPAFAIEYGEGNSLSDLLKNNPEWTVVKTGKRPFAQDQQSTSQPRMGVAGRSGDDVMTDSAGPAKSHAAPNPAAFDHIQSGYD